MKTFLLAFSSCLSVALTGFSQTAAVPAGEIELTMKNEARAAIDRSVQWLLAHQRENGSFSNSDFPAMTALPLWGITLAQPGQSDAKDKAVQFLLAHAKPSGAIFADPKEGSKGGGLPNYNTALCMTALHLAGGEGTREAVLKARTYMAQSQHIGDDIYSGGFGYDAASQRRYADMNNTVMALEAMKLTESAEDSRKAGEAHPQIDKDAAIGFLTRSQINPELNKAEWVSDDPSDLGGFVYQPDKTNAGSTTNAAGVVKFRAYGSMTYAGLLSLIYADVSKDDPRVRSAFDWSLRHWNLSENPGMGEQGVYYFYNVLTKAMQTMDRDVVTRPDGTQFNWRTEMVRKLVALQKIEPDGTGYWVNTSNRWWEADPVLVTSYSLIALQIALGE